MVIRLLLILITCAIVCRIINSELDYSVVSTSSSKDSVVLNDFQLHQSKIQNRLENSVKAIVGRSFSGQNLETDAGRLSNVTANPKAMRKFISFISSDKYKYDNSTDSESRDLIQRYFWGMRSGIVMELGALQGVSLSESKPLHDLFGWHRILVEANPIFSSRIPIASPDAYGFATAICSEKKYVHYRTFGLAGGAVAGIIEFMNGEFMKKFHPDVYETPPERWKTLPNVEVVSCLPLSSIIKITRIRHINAFILDVEGAELSVLQTINFMDVIFDVICVETEEKYRSTNSTKEITSLLMKNGYKLDMQKGRNSWFIHQSFTPQSRLPS